MSFNIKTRLKGVLSRKYLYSRIFTLKTLIDNQLVA